MEASSSADTKSWQKDIEMPATVPLPLMDADLQRVEESVPHRVVRVGPRSEALTTPTPCCAESAPPARMLAATWPGGACGRHRRA
jgi:hypothetical protein